MLVFPVRGDQMGNAARVVFHRLGLAGNIKTASAGSIGSMMDKIKQDSGFRSSVDAMRKVFIRVEREERGVRIIEDCLAGKLPIPSVMTRSPRIVAALDALVTRTQS